MKRLDRYIENNFLLGMVPVLLLLLILFSFMALAGELEEVGQGLFTLFDAFMVVLYTAPRRMVDLLPVTTLLGGLLGLGAMANHQELIAARVAGMSRSRLAKPVLLIGLALAVLVLVAQSLLIPLAEREANELRARSLVETDVDKSGGLEFWTRSENHFVRVNDVRFGRLLTDVEVFSMDNRGRLTQIIQASRASIAGIDDWLLRDVRVTSIEGPVAREQFHDEMRWPGLLSTEQAAILVMPLEALAPLDLWRLTDFQNQNGLDSHRYRVVLWQQLSIAVAVVGMALLTLPLLLGSIRTVPASQRIVIGGFIGIAFYLLQQLSGHFAGLFGLNPAITIMTPSVVLLAAAIYAQFLEAGRKRRAIRRAKKKLRTV